MKIAFEVNGVLRNTFGKAEEVYQKFFIDDYVAEEGEEEFEYKLNLPITSTTLSNHFVFPDEERLMEFFYVDFPMNIFGHSQSTENSTFHDLNDIYKDLRDEHELVIVSNEIEKSKPATLFFLSKFGCLIESVLFYSEITKNNMWDSIDILLTANPDLLLNIPKDKVVIKYKTNYNKNINSNLEIKSLSELDDKVKTIK